MHVSESDALSGGRAFAPLDVEVVDALITPESWHAVDLDALAPAAIARGQGGPLVVTARFALQPLVAGNDNPAMLPPSSAMFLSSAGVANDDFLPDDAPVSLPEAEADFVPQATPRRLRRVVRAEHAMVQEVAITAPVHMHQAFADAATARAAADAVPEWASRPSAPMRVMPMPVTQPLDWQGMRRLQGQRSTKGLDRASLNSLVILMIGAWLAVVAFGVYKFSTPSNGAKILWER